MLKVRIARGGGEGRAFEIDVDAVKSVARENACDGRDEIRNPLRIGQGEVLASAAERNHDLPALALQVADVGPELFGVESRGRVELHRAFSRVAIGRGERDQYGVPLRGDFAERKG